MALKILYKSSRRRLILFGLVGTLGFILETATLLFLIVFVQISPTMAKFIAFPIVVMLTWALNRKLTFNVNSGLTLVPELRRYFQSALIGMCLNLLTFFVVVMLDQNSIIVAVFASALGALIGFLANYYGCSRFIYSQKRM